MPPGEGRLLGAPGVPWSQMTALQRCRMRRQLIADLIAYGWSPAGARTIARLTEGWADSVDPPPVAGGGLPPIPVQEDA